jgi:succinate dehydrogenase / fumarate reductase flavoprotein subunit
MREKFWKEAAVLGSPGSLNQSLEKAGRVADYLEFAELLVTDALHRRESCGGHFREEWQEEGEAKRDDDNFCYVGAWQYNGVGAEPTMHKEPLAFEAVHLATRSYK